MKNTAFTQAQRDFLRGEYGRAIMGFGTALETGVSIRWGKPGAKGAVKYIPGMRCRKRNPVLELLNRTLQKLREGYDIVPHETVLP